MSTMEVPIGDRVGIALKYGTFSGMSFFQDYVDIDLRNLHVESLWLQQRR